MPDPKLRERLRRLGLKPLREPAAKRPSPGRTAVGEPTPPVERARLELVELIEEPTEIEPGSRDIDALFAGQTLHNEWGEVYCVEAHYPASHRHAGGLLDDFRLRDAATAAALARDPILSGVPLESLAFVDTETTGLSGGAGAFAFLIGVGRFTERGFVLRQYFLRDPAEEAALLGAFAADCEPTGGWVTFNGKAFDLPLIDSRYRITHRQRLQSLGRPHLDLLFPARRLFRGRLASCSLGSIEAGVFDLRREEDDVPGWLIPGLYLDYLRTRDARQMRRVMYHNATDVLSMVTLAAHLLEVFARPPGRQHSAEDHLALAQWHEAAGRMEAAEAAYGGALRGHLRPADQIKAHTRYAAFLKRAGRRAEAVEHWEAVFTLAPREIGPCVELAKYYEWQAGDFGSALGWTKVALKGAAHLPGGWQKEDVIAELQRRLERLNRKLGR